MTRRVCDVTPPDSYWLHVFMDATVPCARRNLMMRNHDTAARYKWPSCFVENAPCMFQHYLSLSTWPKGEQNSVCLTGSSKLKCIENRPGNLIQKYFLLKGTICKVGFVSAALPCVTYCTVESGGDRCVSKVQMCGIFLHRIWCTGLSALVHWAASLYFPFFYYIPVAEVQGGFSMLSGRAFTTFYSIFQFCPVYVCPFFFSQCSFPSYSHRCIHGWFLSAKKYFFFSCFQTYHSEWVHKNAILCLIPYWEKSIYMKPDSEAVNSRSKLKVCIFLLFVHVTFRTLIASQYSPQLPICWCVL